MLIEFANRFKIHGLDVECKIDLPGSKTCLLVGENGIGKSSFIQFLKLNQLEFFKSFYVNFIDQAPLSPLNQISYEDLKTQLHEFRKTKEPAFDKYNSLCDEFAKQPIKELSGGQKQLVKLLIGLFLGGDIFIFDEPLQYLDKNNVQAIKNMFLDLKEKEKTLLIVEHQSRDIEELVDKKIFIEKDELVRLYD